MKALPALAAVAWLAVATYAGYRLTARSFAWIDEPGFGLSAEAPSEGGAMLPDIDALKAKLPEIAKDPVGWFKSLTPAQQACLQGAIAPERYQAAMRGGEFAPTPSELLAAGRCLK